MKIMHLLATNSFSGAENVVCQIIDMYKNDKNLDMVYCSPNGKIKNKLVEKNIKFYHSENQHIQKSVSDFLLFGRAFCQYYSCAHTKNRV